MSKLLGGEPVISSFLRKCFAIKATVRIFCLVKKKIEKEVCGKTGTKMNILNN